MRENRYLDNLDLSVFPANERIIVVTCNDCDRVWDQLMYIGWQLALVRGKVNGTNVPTFDFLRRMVMPQIHPVLYHGGAACLSPLFPGCDSPKQLLEAVRLKHIRNILAISHYPCNKVQDVFPKADRLLRTPDKMARHLFECHADALRIIRGMGSIRVVSALHCDYGERKLGAQRTYGTGPILEKPRLFSALA